MDLQYFLENNIYLDTIIKCVISGKLDKSIEYDKIIIEPYYKDYVLMFHVSYVYKTKETHENITTDLFDQCFIEFFQDKFKQAVIFTETADYQLLTNKKNLKIIENKPTLKQKVRAHDHRKQYIIPEGEPCLFLEKLGIMNADGVVHRDKYDKFKQINKYLEFVKTVAPKIEDAEKVLKIIDFGSGKAYLTFALYYYFSIICGQEVDITGIDLKKEVVEFCTQTATDLEFKKLKFICGDISSFTSSDEVDMVITLHACDIATDMAIAHAVRLKSKVIMVVPCCQHELFKQVDNKIMSPLLKHGIIKEKLASLITDSTRALLLESVGYDVQVMEFIDMEHTPKNILIRAIYTGVINKQAEVEFQEFKNFWNIFPTLEKLLRKK